MRLFATCSILVFAALSGVAQADTACPPLTLVTSVDMHIGDDGRVYVPAKIGNVQKSMLVDTGGFLTELTPAAVAELNLTARHTGIELIGVAGDVTDVVTHAPFTIGNLHANMDFMVMASFHRFADDVSDAAGVIGPDHLRPYDADFDFAGKKFNLLSQDHCEGKVVYWPADAVAVVPITINTDWHIIVPVTVDGHQFKAILDTGATNTVLNLEIAKRAFPLHPGDAATPEHGGLDGSPYSKTYTHRFSSLSLEGIAVANPSIELIPDLMRKTDGPEGQSGARHPPSRPQPRGRFRRHDSGHGYSSQPARLRRLQGKEALHHARDSAGRQTRNTGESLSTNRFLSDRRRGELAKIRVFLSGGGTA